jgi:hypothetical protein
LERTAHALSRLCRGIFDDSVAAKARPDMGLHVETPAVRMCMTVMNTASLLRKVRQMGRFLVDFVPVQSKFVADPIPK